MEQLDEPRLPPVGALAALIRGSRYNRGAMRNTLLTSLALLVLAGGCAPGERKTLPSAAPSSWRAIYTSSLGRWSGPAMQYWSPKDGAIVGHSDTPLKRNEFIWS